MQTAPHRQECAADSPNMPVEEVPKAACVPKMLPPPGAAAAGALPEAGAKLKDAEGAAVVEKLKMLPAALGAEAAPREKALPVEAEAAGNPGERAERLADACQD